MGTNKKYESNSIQRIHTAVILLIVLCLMVFVSLYFLIHKAYSYTSLFKKWEVSYVLVLWNDGMHLR